MFAVSVSTSVLASQSVSPSRTAGDRASENVQLVLDFAPSVPMFVVGDPLRLKQVRLSSSSLSLLATEPRHARRCC